MFSRSWSMAFGDSGAVLWFILYWFCHSVGQLARMIPADVASLNAIFSFLVEETAYMLSLSIGNMVIYPFIVSQRLMWYWLVIRRGFFKLPIMYAFCRSAASQWNSVSLWNMMQSSSNLEVFIRSPLCLTPFNLIRGSVLCTSTTIQSH